MRTVITGHLGFIGGHLSKSSPEFVGLDIKEGNDILFCDLPPADLVIHLAAEPGVVKSMEEPLHNAYTNILGTIRLIQHYKDAKFIFASSGGTIQETIESAYGLSKYAAEEYIKMFHDNYVILRFPNVYGFGSRSVVDKFLSDDITIYGDGSATRTYGHVKDIVRGIIQSIEWPTGTYKLGGENFTVLEIADMIGKEKTFKPVRKGELAHSHLSNITPDWEPDIKLENYIREILYNLS